MKIAKATLECCCLVPTAPDTLWCHPYLDVDSFIIEQLPNVYFIGNQPEYQSELLEFEKGKVRVILVPNFQETGTIVLVNTLTLETQKVSFNCEF